MKAYTTADNLRQALDMVNKRYEGNVEFNRFNVNRTHVIITLRVKDSRGPGHRLGQGHLMGYGGPRRLVSACWHVHGHFFDALLSIDNDARIVTSGKNITRFSGNWEDWNIGSMMHPVYYSKACECD